MVYDGVLEGKYVFLKSVGIDDAEFTLSLRKNPALTKYLPKLDISVDEQRKWIDKQRSKSGDYFFIARSYDDIPIGTVSLYNVEENTSESGRLALVGNAVQNTEAVLLLFKFAFDILKVQNVTGYILDGNRRADRFNKQFGCITGSPEKNEAGEMIRRTQITRDSFHQAEKKLENLLYKANLEFG